MSASLAWGRAFARRVYRLVLSRRHPLRRAFSVDIVPVFNTRCVACHLTGDEPGKMALTPESAYSSLVGVPSAEAALLRVKPGDPDASYLVKKIEGQQKAAGGIGERMPFGGPALDAETIAAIRAWIAAGAKND